MTILQAIVSFACERPPLILFYSQNCMSIQRVHYKHDNNFN